jgi:hypothetical protein
MANGIRAIALIGIALCASAECAGAEGTKSPPGSPEWMKQIVVGADGVTPSPSPAEWMKAITYPDAGNWEWLLYASDYSSVWLVSRRNAVRHGNVVSVWVRIENRESQQDLYSGKYYLSGAYRDELDCDNPATRVVSSSLYGARNLGGDTVSSRAYQPEQVVWSPAVPGTIGDSLVTWVCANFKSPAPKSTKQ